MKTNKQFKQEAAAKYEKLQYIKHLKKRIPRRGICAIRNLTAKEIKAHDIRTSCRTY